MTTRPDAPTDLFVVVGVRRGVRLEITARSPMAAAAAADLWRHYHHPEPMTVDWFLRADLPHAQPVWLFTHGSDAVVHATELIAGKPAASHPETCCGLALDWDAEAARVCWPDDGPPCPACLSAAQGASC
jgi:hypothetical protein